jgi:hypothetical protein
MISQLAQVFSSQGVVLPGAERVPVYGRTKGEAPCDHKSDCSCFAPKFDQAAAKLEISRRAMEAVGGKEAAAPGEADTAANGKPGAAKAASGPKKADGKPLNEEEAKQVRELEKRDREVKAHEAAHKAGAGGYAKGGAGYDYQTGPDGKRYAVGGHVDIDAGPIQGNPRATLRKAMTVQRAALAPADPSGADRAVAAAAAQMALQAQKELAQQASGGQAGEPGSGPGNPEGNPADRDPRRAYAQPMAVSGRRFSAYA